MVDGDPHTDGKDTSNIGQTTTISDSQNLKSPMPLKMLSGRYGRMPGSKPWKTEKTIDFFPKKVESSINELPMKSVD